MARREKAILLRLSSSEYTRLKRKAAKMGMNVSAYIRFAAIESDNLQIITIDTTPLERLNYELTKQGVNLNQLMKFLNSYGVDAYNAQETSRILAREGNAFLQVMDALADLRHEAAKHRVYILKNDKGLETDSEEMGLSRAETGVNGKGNAGADAPH